MSRVRTCKLWHLSCWIHSLRAWTRKPRNNINCSVFHITGHQKLKHAFPKDKCINWHPLKLLNITAVLHINAVLHMNCCASHQLPSVCFRFDLVEIKHMQNKTQIKLFVSCRFQKSCKRRKNFRKPTLTNLENVLLASIPFLNCTLSGDRRTFEPFMHEFLRNLVP